MKKASFITVLLAVLAFGSVAQESGKHSEADYQVVYQLFEAANVKKTMENNTAKMLDMQIRNLPALGIYRDELLNFINKHTSYEALKTELADIYLKYYTAADMKELTKFYATPLGQKYLRINDQLTSDVMELAMNKIMTNKQELQQIIMKKKQETEKNKNNGAEQ